MSSVRAYEACPKSYHFAHVLRAQVEGRVPEHWRFGTVVHAGLEAGYREVAAGAEVAALKVRDVAAEAARLSWQKEEMPATGGGLDRALEMLDVTFEKHPPLRSADIIGIEHKMLHTTPDGTTVIGYADLVTRTADDAIEVTDHKVTSKVMRGEDLENDLQGNTYGWLALNEWPWARRVYFTHHYPPVARRVTVALTIDGMMDAVSRLECSAEMVEMDTEFRPRPGDRCTSCIYRPLCPAWIDPDTNSALQAMARF